MNRWHRVPVVGAIRILGHDGSTFESIVNIRLAFHLLVIFALHCATFEKARTVIDEREFVVRFANAFVRGQVVAILELGHFLRHALFERMILNRFSHKRNKKVQSCLRLWSQCHIDAHSETCSVLWMSRTDLFSTISNPSPDPLTQILFN